MNGITRVIVPATITDVSDGPYFYAACQQCYSKLVESSDTFLCPKCRRRLSRDKVEFRYRLSMTITDFSTFAPVTAFGGMLNAYFGCSASEFGKRWITKLQGLVGSLERPITKWAVEESLVGCHLHFGFKIHPKALGIHKVDRKHGISLRDIKLQHDKSSYSQADSNLVAVQMITQNNAQLPVPAVSHLQRAMSSFGDIKKGLSSTEIEVQRFIQKMYSRNRQKESDQNLTSSLKFSAEEGSVLSSLDETSIALGCSDSLWGSMLSDKLTTNQHSQACDFLWTQSESKLYESPDANSKKDDVLYVSPQCIADAQIMSEDEFKEKNNTDINPSSILLFESPDSFFNHDKSKELPRNVEDGSCSLVTCLPDRSIDLSSLKVTEISRASSDRLSSHHMSELIDRSNAALPLCHYVNCENECHTSSTSRADGMNHSLKKHNGHIENSELKKLSSLKFSNGKLSLKHLTSKPKSNKRLNFNCEKRVDSLDVSAKIFPGCMAESLILDSSTSHETLTRCTLIDMPESEDLELFLKAANSSRDELEMKGVSYDHSPAHTLENNQIHHQLVHDKSGVRKDKVSQPASPHFNHDKRKQTPCINKHSYENIMSAHMHCRLTNIGTYKYNDSNRRIQLHHQKENAQSSVASASKIYESSKVRSSDLVIEEIRHEKGNVHKEFTLVNKFFKNNPSAAVSDTPSLLNNSKNKMTDCDTALNSRQQDSCGSGVSNPEEQVEMNDSFDLFSSPEAFDFFYSKDRSSDLVLKKIQHKKGDVHRESTMVDTFSKNNPSAAVSYKPSLLLNNSNYKMTDCDTALNSRQQDSSGSGVSNSEEQGEMNNSFDLFSSPEAVDSILVNTFKGLTVIDRTSPSKMNFTCDSPLAAVHAGDCNNVESETIQHDGSYNLFATPYLKTYENRFEDVSRSVSSGFQPDCNSFDLFSSSEEEL